MMTDTIPAGGPRDDPVENGTTTILWRSVVLASAERFTDQAIPGGRELSGLVLTPLDGAPATVSYRVVVDPTWRTRTANVDIERPGARTTRIALRRDSVGRWTRDGAGVDELEGCIDVDLGFTPSTNTLPIRRLDLAVGQSQELPVAWLRFPELSLDGVAQTYTRLADDRWRYQSGEHDFELEVDDAGHVLRYGDALWSAVARTGG